MVPTLAPTCLILQVSLADQGITTELPYVFFKVRNISARLQYLYKIISGSGEFAEKGCINEGADILLLDVVYV